MDSQRRGRLTAALIVAAVVVVVALVAALVWGATFWALGA